MGIPPRYSCLVAILLGAGTLQVRSQPAIIQGLIDAVNRDSLVAAVKVLSGESPVEELGVTIRTRAPLTSGHDWTVDYLTRRLESLGLTVQREQFVTAYSLHGMNLIALQPGVWFPNRTYILSAHYDAKSNMPGIAPGADDNASGCAVTLEAARLLSAYRTACSVLYAFWDLEEQGALGSLNYAAAAWDRGDSIVGVVNVDMVGYDGDNDSLMDLHANNVGTSAAIADTVLLLNRLHKIGLNPTLYNPSDMGSDQLPFWQYGYSAVALSEVHFGSDRDPNYHKYDDVLSLFNLDYFHRQARLAVASIATLAKVVGPLSVSARKPLPVLPMLEQNYPNPFNPSTTIRYGIPRASRVRLTVHDVLGKEVVVLVDEVQEAGNHEVRFNPAGIASGVYFYRLHVGAFIQTKPLILLR